MADYYASPTGLSSNSGAIGSPWDLKTALANGSQTSGDTLWLRDGTYSGRYTSTLNGGTVRSYPGEWAIIDALKTTTLNGSTNASQTTITFASTAGFIEGKTFGVELEIMYITAVLNSTQVTVVRGWDSTTAVTHTNGATVYLTGNALTVSGNNTTYRNFEVMTSYTVRDYNISGPQNHNGYYAIVRGAAISQFTGSWNSYINLLIHDNGNGLFLGSSTSNTLIYGNVIYNIGAYHRYNAQPAGDIIGAGLGLYLENVSGFSRAYNNIIVNSYASCGKGYGQTGPYVGGDIKRNIFANAGSPLGAVRGADYRTWNFLYGPNDQQSPTGIFSENHTWQLAGSTGGTALTFGYNSGIGAGTLNDNYIIGGPEALEIINVTTLTGSGNKIYNASGLYIKNFDVATGTFNNNTYYDSDGRNVFGLVGVGNLSFEDWQTATGWDAGSSETGTIQPDSVHVIPNEYDIGRANIAIHAPSGATSINVDLATTGLVHNQEYEIKNAFNWYGSDVATGVYDAGSTTISVTLNTAAATVATPTGNGFTPATTAPDFVALVVVPGAADASAPGTPTGLTASVGQSNSTTGTFQLAWTLGAGTETSVTVRRIVNGVTTDIPLAADVTSYTDTGQTVGLSYTYAVKASNAAGDSAWSDTVQKVLTGLTCFGAPPSIG